ncbi:MAG: glycosyltransferase [Cellulosilyticaceae bacterium]
MKIAILTMFKNFSTTYSLVNVVAEHLEMLLEAYDTIQVLVREDCDFSHLYGIFLDSRIEWVPITHHLEDAPIALYDYSDASLPLHATFSQEVAVIAQSFVSALKDTDLCIMHDILYQGWHYVHNIAIRRAQKELPLTRFIAFTHSLPTPRPQTLTPSVLARFIPMPRTLFAYPTYAGLPLLAKQYGVPEASCRAVYNTLSLLQFLSPEVQTLHQHTSLLSSELLIIYPGRLTPSKRFEKVAALAGVLHTVSQKSVKVIFCDFPSMDIPSDTYKDLIRTEGESYGLPNDAISFTSDCGFPDGFPRQGVLDLFTLSNIFICPSYSESFGLTVLEAASRGNFLILNENVPALYELGLKLHAYFMHWDAYCPPHSITEHYPSSEKDYYMTHAKKILHTFAVNTALYAKTQTRCFYQPDTIWYHQLKPLIESALLLD